MARPLRVEYPGALYLVTATTLPRQKLVRDLNEMNDFKKRVPELVEAFDAVFHGYCVLPSRYHLLVETPRGNLSRILHRLNAGYTATLNARRRRRGPLLHSRYRSILIDEHPWLLDLSVYIHLTPVRERLARGPWSYEGSTAKAFRPDGPEIPGVTTSRIIELAGGRDAYGRLMEDGVRRPPKPPWNQVWRQVVLGGTDLRARALEALEGKDARELSGFSEGREGLTLNQVVETVAEGTGVPPEEILRGKFQRVLARKVGLYLVRRFTGLTLRQIGEAFGVDYTTVHMASRRVEELRERDPSVNEFVTSMEQKIRSQLPGSRAVGPQEPTSKRERRRKPARRKDKDSSQLPLF